jgi:hypothetical protein
MNFCIEMTAEQLAEQVLLLNWNEEISFATEVEHPSLDKFEKGEPLLPEDCCCWLGITRLKIFDSDLVLICHYGGGYTDIADITFYDYAKETVIEKLEDAFQEYGNDTVFVEQNVKIKRNIPVKKKEVQNEQSQT